MNYSLMEYLALGILQVTAATTYSVFAAAYPEDIQSSRDLKAKITNESLTRKTIPSPNRRSLLERHQKFPQVLVATLNSHTELIHAVIISPDGKKSSYIGNLYKN